jgi:hypothetical protein
MIGRGRDQGGATMVIALIMLLLLTLAAMTALNMGKSSLQIVGNLQGRNQELVTANGVSEQVLSSTQFFNNPMGVLNVGGAWMNSTSVDVYGDGKTVLPVTVTPPSCIAAQGIPVTNLVLTNPDDKGCSRSVQQTFGVAGADTAMSLCATSTWDIATQATDPVTSGSATVTQGVAVRIPLDDQATSCP